MRQEENQSAKKATNFRAPLVYRTTLNLVGPSNKKAREAALVRAHEIRQFEIELYWKRANYFWLLQAAVFAAVGLTWRADSNLPVYVPVALSALGILTGLGGWLATQGSKFWQTNWEHHIDMLEGEFEGDLYKTVFVSDSGVRWSLSGVSETLALWFTIFWVFLFVATAVHANPHWNLAPTDLAAPNANEIITIAIGLFAFVGSIHLLSKKGRIRGDLTPYPDDFSPGEPYTLSRSKQAGAEQRFLMRREPQIR